MISPAVAAYAENATGLPAFVYDLDRLAGQATTIRRALAGTAEFYYAAKANPDRPILETIAPYVHGIEVSSGGELAHVRSVLPNARLAFGGPGKTPEELAAAVAAGARVHVESPTELRRLIALRRDVDVLLRVNPPFDVSGAALAMGGSPTPFGMDEPTLAACLPLLAGAPQVRIRGIHAHLASGLDATTMVTLAEQLLNWSRPWCERLGVDAPEFNVGGGMAVDYGDPLKRFDWTAYGAGLASLKRPGETLRIEPGRAVSVYSGWYLTDVLDLKPSHGNMFAVLRGGTHHLRTPATKGHDQPFTVLRRGGQPVPGPVTLVGQLCTPKDVFAREVPVKALAIGDVVAFAMCGAYAWNISHHDFLMHPKPSFVYLAR